MAETVLAVENLRKSFGALKATDDVSLDLRAGEIHALIGPKSMVVPWLPAMRSMWVRISRGNSTAPFRKIQACSWPFG